MQEIVASFVFKLSAVKLPLNNYATTIYNNRWLKNDNDKNFL